MRRDELVPGPRVEPFEDPDQRLASDLTGRSESAASSADPVAGGFRALDVVVLDSASDAPGVGHPSLGLLEVVVRLAGGKLSD